MRFSCVECNRLHEPEPARAHCGSCGGLLEVLYDDPQAPPSTRTQRPPGVWRYRETLPPVTDPITLGEGGTGLHACPRLAEWVGVRELHVKNEGENPTGSFKDRGMTVGVSYAREMGHEAVGCASTGNTSASLAAYGARGGLRVVVLVPQGKVALGKIAQALVHDARVLEVRGNFDEALKVVRELAEEGEVVLMNSVNPVRLEGQKTLVWEVLDALDAPPDHVVFPVGNAGNLSAAHKAFREWEHLGLLEDVPALTGVQAEGAAPFVDLVRGGGSRLEPEADPETRATAIRIGHPVNWPKALPAVRDTGGTATAVPDAAILEAQSAIARLEGLFVEPASAASVAGLRALVDAGEVDPTESIVCVTTGNGLKDPDAVVETHQDALVPVDATLDAVLEAMTS